jgi:hypothetical protein
MLCKENDCKRQFVSEFETTGSVGNMDLRCPYWCTSNESKEAYSASVKTVLDFRRHSK